MAIKKSWVWENPTIPLLKFDQGLSWGNRFALIKEKFKYLA